jgi:hypothetical protein
MTCTWSLCDSCVYESTKMLLFNNNVGMRDTGMSGYDEAESDSCPVHVRVVVVELLRLDSS